MTAAQHQQGAEAAPLLEVRGLSIEIAAPEGLLHPVNNVSFSLREGEALALVGESGCGKSLTAMAVMRLLPRAARVSAGEIWLAGRELLSMTEEEMRAVRGAGAAVVFQEPATSFNPVMTVGAQVVEMIRAHRSASEKEAAEEARYWFGRAGIPDPARCFAAYPHELSGGLKQRAMIAMALSAHPKVIIADEPTTALDAVVQAQILQLLQRLREEERLTLLLITHDLSLLPQTVDRIALMYAGSIAEEAQVEAFFRSPRHPYARALLAAVPTKASRGRSSLQAIEGLVPKLSSKPRACAFAPRCRLAKPICFKRRPPERLVGSGEPPHRVFCFYADEPQPFCEAERRAAEPPKAGEAQAPALSIEGLSVMLPPSGVWRRRPGRTLVNGVTLSVARGETLALVGGSGCGKTTTAMAALGLLPAGLRAVGAIRAAGSSFAAGGARSDAFRKAVQVIFQDPFSSLDPRMTVREVLGEALAALMPELDAAAREARSLALLKETGLPPEAMGRYPHEFSGGQRQRIAIARALAGEPQVIICDEPTSALDVSVQAQVLNLLKRLQRERGLSYLLITHNFGVVAFAADRIAVMDAGCVAEVGSAEEILERPKSPAAQALLASVPALPDEALRALQSAKSESAAG